MEKFEELKELSKKKIHLADHMLTQTYPLINDPRMLITVLENIFLSLSYSMSSLLYYEQRYKRVPLFKDTFEQKFEVFKEYCVTKHVINPTYVHMIKEIKDILLEHRKSPMEFVRNDRLVICSDTYHMKTIDIPKLRQYIQDTKNFVKEMNALVSNEAVLVI